jgi:hypothetical protein
VTAWEEGFLCSLVETGWILRPLTDKQWGVLERIAAKVGVPAPARDMGSAETCPA